MSEEKIITEEEIHINPMLACPVDPDTELKSYLIDYVGKKLSPENEEVTVNMIAEVLATDFSTLAITFSTSTFSTGSLKKTCKPVDV